MGWGKSVTVDIAEAWIRRLPFLACVVDCIKVIIIVHLDAVTSPPTIPPPTTAVAATTPPVEEPCINGKLFEMCGSACPPTCDNYQSPVPCPLICVQGCFCPHGLVELGDMCVPPTSCPGELQYKRLFCFWCIYIYIKYVSLAFP